MRYTGRVSSSPVKIVSVTQKDAFVGNMSVAQPERLAGVSEGHLIGFQLDASLLATLGDTAKNALVVSICGDETPVSHPKVIPATYDYTLSICVSKICMDVCVKNVYRVEVNAVNERTSGVLLKSSSRTLPL